MSSATAGTSNFKVIENFGALPPRRGGGGGGKPPGELLVAARKLQPGQGIEININPDEGESFTTAAKRETAKLTRKKALDFKIMTRSMPSENKVIIYRPTNEELAQRNNQPAQAANTAGTINVPAPKDGKPVVVDLGGGRKVQITEVN